MFAVDENFKHMVLNGARDNFAQSGEVAPMLLGVRDEKLVVFPLGSVMKDKEAVGQIISAMRMRVAVLAFVTEGWMVRQPTDEDLKVALKDHPDREEVVMASFYQGMEQGLLLAKISRSEGNPPVLGDWEDRLQGGVVKGRMFKPPSQWN